MNRKFLEDVAPLLTEMLLDGIAVEIIPYPDRAYPDMRFYVQDAETFIFLHYRGAGCGNVDADAFVILMSNGGENVRETRPSFFAALGLVLLNVRAARWRKGDA